MAETYNEPVELTADMEDLVVEMPTQELMDEDEDEQA